MTTLPPGRAHQGTTVRTATPGEWRVLRDLRLAALQDTPAAFGSTYAQEATRAEQYWQDRAARGSTFLAYVTEIGAEPVGLAGGYLDTPDVAELISMWVSPRARGRGVGEALIERVTQWAREQTSAAALHLWVTAGNQPAERLYERCGFVPTGERQPLPSDPSLDEFAMSRPIQTR